MSKKENKPVNKTFETFNNLYAGGKIVNLGEHPRFPEKVDTGRPSIDYVTDGGFPKGRLILIAGEKSAGKSTLVIQMCKNFGKKILYIDTEMTLTNDYIESLGADVNTFNHVIPSTTEQMCDIMREQIPNFDLIVVDSINNSSSREQLQKTAGERTMANRAIVLTNQLPILVGMANQYNTSLIFLSQVRDNMNKANKYSPDKVIPGGNSLHHNSSMTLELYKSTKEKSDDVDLMSSSSKKIAGNMVRIKCTKNKVGEAMREVKIKFINGKGYIEEADIASSAIRLKIVDKKGSWISYKDTSIAQGETKFIEVLKDNPDLLDELKEEINKLNS